jgi:hypothetical protein
VDFLSRAVGAYRRTLAIDSENIAAHFGLGLAYAELSRKAGPGVLPPPRYDRRPDGGLDRAIIAQAEAATEAGVEPRMRGARALDLAATIRKFLAMPPTEFVSRLEPLHVVVERLGPALAAEADPATQAAMARALEAAHKALHAMFKPDETAEGRAVAIARRDDPAADQNAQSIVIHGLHRPGAPGVEAATAAVAKDKDVEE